MTALVQVVFLRFSKNGFRYRLVFVGLVLENQPATRKKSDVQGFMNDSGPKLSPEHDRLSWTGVRFGQLSLIGANWTLISVFPNSLIF